MEPTSKIYVASEWAQGTVAAMCYIEPSADHGVEYVRAKLNADRIAKLKAEAEGQRAIIADHVGENARLRDALRRCEIALAALQENDG